VLIDQKGGNNLIYLPLDKIMQMTGTGPGAVKPGEAPPVQEPSTTRSREAFRSREREAR
jgi:membrane protease subunit HflK